MKRLTIATLFGLMAGGICATIAFSGNLLPLTATTLAWILLNRTVMGFAIGASSLRLHWTWNGIVIGVVVGSIFSFYLYMHTGLGKMALLTPIGNAIFGLMIEFFTTVVFRQPAAARQRRVQAVSS